MASLDSIKELYKAAELHNIVMNRIILAEDDPKKISVALHSFAKISDDEMPLLMYDNTATCNGKEGFLLTNKKLYVGNSYETPVAIDLQSITSVEAKPKLISSVIIVNDIKIDASGLLKKDLLQVGDFLQKVIPLAMQVEKPKEKPVEVPKKKLTETVETKKKELAQDNNPRIVEKKTEGKESIASILENRGGIFKRYQKADEANGAFINLYCNGIKAAFFEDHFEIQYPNTEYKSFKWDSITIAIAEGGIKEHKDKTDAIRGNMAFILFDNTGKECFYGIEKDAYCKSGWTTEWTGLTPSLIYFIDWTISDITKKEVTYDNDIQPHFQIRGDAIEDEETRKTWNNLMTKWNEIFSRTTPIECKLYTDLELAKLPKWRRKTREGYPLTAEDCYFTIGDAVIEVGGDMELEEPPYYESYSYYPEPYAETEKYLCFSCVGNGLMLELVSGNKPIKLCSIGVDFMPFDNLKKFFTFLRADYKWKGIYENILSFSKRLNEAYLDVKKNENAQSLDDLSNW